MPTCVARSCTRCLTRAIVGGSATSCQRRTPLTNSRWRCSSKRRRCPDFIFCQAAPVKGMCSDSCPRNACRNSCRAFKRSSIMFRSEVLVKKTAVPGLYLLPSGACKGNVFGLLSAERMSKLLPRFQEEFDYVLVDAPPCLEFADARIIGRHAGELLLVVRANHTHPKAAQAAIEGIRLDGLPLLGVILNRWNPGHSSIYARARGVL